MEEEIRIAPRISAYENYLNKLMLELWECDNNNDAEFAKRVYYFVDHWFPWRDELAEKFPYLYEKMLEMMKRLDTLEKVKANADPLMQETIAQSSIPKEEADFAREVWRAVNKIHEEKGFYYPLASTGFFDVSRGKKSGMGKYGGFPSKLPDTMT